MNLSFVGIIIYGKPTERKKQMAGKLCFSTRVQHLPETFLSDLRKVLVEACR
jgi:hypothetical protein